MPEDHGIYDEVEMNGAPPMDQILGDLLASLRTYLRPLPSPLPEPGVSIVTLKERPLAIGNSIGSESIGSFSIIELKGGRLETEISFQLWGSGPSEVDAEVEALHERLLAARDDLRSKGFIKLSAGGASVSEQIESLNAWRKTANFDVLYEFNYQDTDDALSIITRIPIDIDGESIIISDEIVRWDNQAAPMLEIKGLTNGGFRIGAVYILAFLPPDWDGGEVSISSFIGGIRRELKFSSVRVFRDAFNLEKDGGVFKTVNLGGQSYFAGVLKFPNADFPDQMVLRKEEDVLRINYSTPSFNSNAVVYLRLQSNV